MGELDRLLATSQPVRCERAVGLKARRLAVQAKRLGQVPFGQLVVAAAIVHASQLVLDRADPVGGDRGRRGLVGRESSSVLPAQRVQVADRFMQRGGVTVPQGQRRVVCIERLTVGMQRARAPARLAKRVGGLLFETGRLKVARDQPRVAMAGGQLLGHAAVQQPPPGEAGALIGEGQQLVVGEVVPLLPFDDQAAPGQLLQALHRLLVAAATGVAQRRDVERAPDHRRRREQLRGGLAGAVQPCGEQLADASR